MAAQQENAVQLKLDGIFLSAKLLLGAEVFLPNQRMNALGLVYHL